MILEKWVEDRFLWRKCLTSQYDGRRRSCCESWRKLLTQADVMYEVWTHERSKQIVLRNHDVTLNFASSSRWRHELESQTRIIICVPGSLCTIVQMYPWALLQLWHIVQLYSNSKDSSIYMYSTCEMFRRNSVDRTVFSQKIWRHHWTLDVYLLKWTHMRHAWGTHEAYDGYTDVISCCEASDDINLR